VKQFRDTVVGRSIYRSPDRSTRRDQAAGHWSNFLLHLYPVKVKKHELRFRWSWFLGVSSMVLFISLIVSGIYLMFFYVPIPSSAYGDIQRLQTDVAFGQFIRNVHRWSAHLMVLTVAAHLARMFYRGAYKPPREFNWIIGVVLLVLTLLLSFTGYLLPWDQLAYWAVTVGSSMAGFVPLIGKTLQEILIGGNQVGAATLLRFYVYHIAVLPTLVVGLLMLHIWRWRKDATFDLDRTAAGAPPVDGQVAADRRVLGIVPGVPATGRRKDTSEQTHVMTSPHLLIRHATVALFVLLVVLVISLLFDAPLREIANPFETPNPEKAPWYFAALQELLSLFHPMVAGILVPGAIIIGLVVLPYIDRSPETSAGMRRVGTIVFTIFLVGWVLLTLIGFAFRGANWEWVWPWVEWHGEL
jgi:quinol-cytochrome oxidoreductase complex cytochrome b subunit